MQCAIGQVDSLERDLAAQGLICRRLHTSHAFHSPMVEPILDEFAPTCWWQQTWPGSHFRQSTICSRLTPSGRVSLSGRTLIETRDGTRTETALPTDEAVLAAYAGHFGIELDRVPEAVA